LVRLLDYEGDSLKVTLTPYRQIERAPQGTEVSFFIRAYLLELQMRGHCVSREPNLNKPQRERHMAHITLKRGFLTPKPGCSKMTLPHERMRALRWGAELLLMIEHDGSVPAEFRNRAAQLRSQYPTPLRLLELVHA